MKVMAGYDMLAGFDMNNDEVRDRCRKSLEEEDFIYLDGDRSKEVGESKFSFPNERKTKKIYAVYGKRIFSKTKYYRWR